MRVVILGAGFAGLTAARELERTLPASVEILLVDRHNYFLFTPLLAEAATGMVDPGRVVVPLRSFLNRAVTQQAEVTGVDPDRRRVVLRHGAAFSPHDHQVSYDHLVIALGSTTNFFGLPGLEEHAYGFKSLGDALTLRNRVLDALEQADMDADPPRRESLLTFVVGGGAFSGVEIAGALADFVGSAARHYRNLRARDIRILLVEMKDRLLPELPAEMGRFAGEVLTRKGVEIRLQTKVEAAEDGRVVLGGGQAIPTHTLVWTSGVMPPPIVEG